MAKGQQPLQPAEDHGKPLAVPTLQEAAEILDVSLAYVEEAASRITVYTAQDGTPRYSLAQLGRALGMESAQERRRRQQQAVYRRRKAG